MTLTATTTQTFIDHGYLIDIVTNKKDYEAWIYDDESTVKRFMFGAPQEQQSYSEFLDIVYANIDDYRDLCD